MDTYGNLYNYIEYIYIFDMDTYGNIYIYNYIEYIWKYMEIIWTYVGIYIYIIGTCPLGS